MTDRRLTDAAIASALRVHLPADAPVGTRRALLDAVAVTPQQQPPLRLPDWLAPVDLGRNPILVAALLLAALLAALAVAGAWRSVDGRGVRNGWIAYSTDGPAGASTDVTLGSDLYLVREGDPPILVAGRDGGATRNACPSFSPDGTKLAYATSSGPPIVVRGVNDAGLTSQQVRLSPPDPPWPTCIRWSADSKRLAYFDGGREIVLGLDGSMHILAPGDPTSQDFARPDLLEGARSPSGDRSVRFSSPLDGPPCDLIVTQADGTAAHVIRLTFCPYALAGWSPDGRRVLLMEDVSGLDFTMHALDVDGGLESAVVSTVRTNGGRSWPGWGDVSWQPVYP
jgi:hypothetical protein